MSYRHLLNFWPLVPALDLQEVTATKMSTNSEKNSPESSRETLTISNVQSEDSTSKQNNTKELNYLLVGNSIGCLMKTIAHIPRHENKNINLYVAETTPESLTRYLLFLTIFGDPSCNMNLLEKAEIFLEILGNIYVRSSTSTFVDRVASTLLVNIGSVEKSIPSMTFLKLNHLKQNEIDKLVGALTYLKDKELKFESGKAWENALRSYFGHRYDNRKNLFDFHFNLKLADYTIINLNKYIDWCETGIAFKLRKSKYNHANKTLRVQTKESGLRNCSSEDNYVGDIATSPYIVFGIESENGDLFTKANGQYVYTSEDVSKFNVIEILREFTSFRRNDGLKSINIHLMFFDTLCKIRKFKNFFDAIYIPCDMMHCSNKFLPKLLKEKGVVVFETIQNIVNSTKEQKMKHAEGIINLADSSGLVEMECGKFSETGNYKIFTLSDKML